MLDLTKPLYYKARELKIVTKAANGFHVFQYETKRSSPTYIMADDNGKSPEGEEIVSNKRYGFLAAARPRLSLGQRCYVISPLKENIAMSGTVLNDQGKFYEIAVDAIFEEEFGRRCQVAKRFAYDKEAFLARRKKIVISLNAVMVD